ncbi:hypothetical protein ABPG75_005973 [Micractinium tetrahymenae]
MTTDQEAARQAASAQPPASSDSSQQAVVPFAPTDKQDAESARELIAEALLQDQSVTYFAKRKLRHQLGVWREMVRLNYAAALSYSEPPLFFTTACRNSAALCFLYPAQQVSMWQYIRHGGLAPLVQHFRASRWLPALKHQAALDREKARCVERRGPLLFVFVLATRAEHRNRGLGSRLLRRIAAEADARGLWCYLEASSPDNRRLYLRHGYQDVKELRPEPRKEGSPVYYIMERPPGCGAAAAAAAAAAETEVWHHSSGRAA